MAGTSSITAKSTTVECMYGCCRVFGISEPIFSTVEECGKQCVNLSVPYGGALDVMKLSNIDFPSRTKVFIVKDDNSKYVLHFCNNSDHLPYTKRDINEFQESMPHFIETTISYLREKGDFAESNLPVFKDVVNFLGPASHGARFYSGRNAKSRFQRSTKSQSIVVEIKDDELDAFAVRNLLRTGHVTSLLVKPSLLTIVCSPNKGDEREVREE